MEYSWSHHVYEYGTVLELVLYLLLTVLRVLTTYYLYFLIPTA